jgi:hypothetical protein
MDLHSRRDLMDSMSKRYPQASKASKTRILDEVCAATGFHRKYAITRINLIETSQPCKTVVHREREKIYGREVLSVVQKVWEEAGYPWSVRLKAILLLWLPAIRKRYALSRAVEAQLVTISPRTEVREAVLGRASVIEGIKPGSLVVDMSSIAPLVSREVSARLADKGVVMLDAPVSGGEPKAIDGSLAIMII